jgi:hypothetical protein
MGGGGGVWIIVGSHKIMNSISYFLLTIVMQMGLFNYKTGNLFVPDFPGKIMLPKKILDGYGMFLKKKYISIIFNNCGVDDYL